MKLRAVAVRALFTFAAVGFLSSAAHGQVDRFLQGINRAIDAVGRGAQPGAPSDRPRSGTGSESQQQGAEQPRWMDAAPRATEPSAPQATSANPESRVVVVDGIGTDINAATQNAAVNALTNVAGTFISAEKALERRTQIQDGIRSQTRNLSSSVKEYSQGSIRSIEILETGVEGPLTKVTARVTVRLEDFRAFVKKLAEGEAVVQGGLFDRLAVDQRQEGQLTDILVEKVFLPVLQGEAVRFRVAPPESASDAVERIVQSIRARSHPTASQTAVQFRSEADRLISEIKPRALIYLRVQSFLDDGFLSNAVQAAESTAKAKVGVDLRQSDSWRSHYRSENDFLAVLSVRRGNILENALYVWPNSRPALLKKAAWFELFSKKLAGSEPGLGGMPSMEKEGSVKLPKLQITFVDGAGNPLERKVIRGIIPMSGGLLRRDPYDEGGRDYAMWPGDSVGPIWNLLIPFPNEIAYQAPPVLLASREFGLFLPVDLARVREAKSVHLALVR